MSNNTTKTNTTIEVAAMLGESVVDVKHVSNGSNKASTVTKAMFAVGAGALVAAAASFGISVHTAAQNKSGLETWTRTLHKPAHSFRADQGSALVDATAAAGGALGLLGVTLGLARLRREKKKNVSYRIGTAAGVELAIENAPSDDYELVSANGTFNVAQGMSAEMIVDGTSTPLAAGQIQIPANAKIRAKLGRTTVVASAVEAPAEHGNPLFNNVDKRAMKYAAGSLAAHLAAVAFLALVPVEASSTNIEFGTNESIAMKSSTSENQDANAQLKTEQGDAAQAGADGSIAMQTEGKSGKTDATKPTGETKVARTSSDIEIARAEAREIGRQSNPFANESIATQIAIVTGSADMTGAMADVDSSGVDGDGDGNGDGGFGNKRGNKLGSCPIGVSSCLLSSGPYNKIKGGHQTGEDYTIHTGTGDPIGPRDPRVPTVPGRPTVVGDLDKEIIKRRIRQASEKIGYCYETRLMADHQLGDGALTVTFFISPNGTVASSSSSGFDSKVGSCVSDVIAAIEFPRPNGGGGVQVNYPFSFHKTGA